MLILKLKSTMLRQILLICLVLIVNSNTKLIKEIQNYQLDKNFKDKYIQFYIITQKEKSDKVKEVLRKIEKTFFDFELTIEDKWGLGKEGLGSEIYQRIELFEIERSSNLEYRFGLEKQMSDEERPIKINDKRNGKVLSYTVQ